MFRRRIEYIPAPLIVTTANDKESGGQPEITIGHITSCIPVVQKKDLQKFTDWSDFDKAEVKVAATLGTVQEKMVKEFFPSAKHIVIEAPARDFQELLARRADVSVTSNVEAATLVEKFKQLAIVPVKEPRKPTPIAMLLPQDDQVWINYINHWVELKKTQGFFKQTAEKWGLKSK